MAYGAPINPPKPILMQHMYHMPRKNLAQALELDELTKSLDVSIGVGLQMLASDHEMMDVIYRSNHWSIGNGSRLHVTKPRICGSC